MKRIRTKIIIGLITLVLLSLGCKTASTSQKAETKPLPESFATQKDTVNMATIKWDVLYSDSNLKNLIELALTNNYDLLIAMQKIEIIKSTVRLNKGLLYPTVNVNAG